MLMITYRQCCLYLLLLALAGGTGCVQPAPKERMFVATIPPLGAILQELTAGRAKVNTLLNAGASPHTYEPNPSDAKAAEKSLGLFYIDSSVDGWAARFANQKRIAVFALLPDVFKLPSVAMSGSEGAEDGEEHSHHSTEDAHFWSSPRAVRALLPELADELARLDPGGADIYRANARVFATKLDELDIEITALLAPVKGASVLLFHPSLQYLLTDYGLNIVAVVEPSPGKEPKAKWIADLVALAREKKLKALFTEPQLPEAPVRVLSEEAHLPVFVLDPLGGQSGRETYEELIKYNARTLAEALQ